MGQKNKSLKTAGRTQSGGQSQFLSDDESAYLITRLPTVLKTSTGQPTRKVRWFTLAIQAAGSALTLKHTVVPLIGDRVILDHSDLGIQKLYKLHNVPWQIPANIDVTLFERVRTSAMCFSFVLKNRHGLLWSINAKIKESICISGSSIERRVDSVRTKKELVQGVIAMNQLLTLKDSRPDTWQSVFMTGDISILRQFAASAAVRSNCRIFCFLGHPGEESSVIVCPDVLFTFNSKTQQTFARKPVRTIVVKQRKRLRKVPFTNYFDVGILVDNWVELEQVKQASEAIACLVPSVKSVQIRLHPASKRRLDLTPIDSRCVLTPVSMDLQDFAELIDFCLVSASSAVPVVQQMNVPCFYTSHFYGVEFQQHATGFLARNPFGLPECHDDLATFVSSLTTDLLTAEIERLQTQTRQETEMDYPTSEEIRHVLELR